MSSSDSLLPEHVFIVDKRLLPATNSEKKLNFIQLTNPRTKQQQSYAFDNQSKTIFEVNQCTRSHSSWFIDDQYVLPDGSMYLVTPIHLNFLLLPLLWSQARTDSIALSKLLDKSFQQIDFDDEFLLDKLNSICDIDSKQVSVKLNEDKLIVWLRDRVDRLKKHVDSDEHAFDLICEYLTDDLIEFVQKQLNLHGNVRYDTPIGQKLASLSTTVVTKKTVEVTTKSKRSKK